MRRDAVLQGGVRSAGSSSAPEAGLSATERGYREPAPAGTITLERSKQILEVRCQLAIRPLHEPFVEHLQPINAVQSEGTTRARIAIQSQQVPGGMVQQQILRLYASVRQALIAGTVPEPHDP